MSYNIHTLFGDTPEVTVKPVIVEVDPVITKDPRFVMGAPSAKIWSVVVQREKDGVLLQKDVTQGMALIEAIDHANNLRQTYRIDGFIESEDGGKFFDQEREGEYVFIFVV